MKKVVILIIIIVSSWTLVHAQNVGINDDGSDPDAAAMLDVKSTSKGILIPRIDYNNKPATPPTGLLIFVTANGPDGNNAFYFYNGSSWEKVAGGAGSDSDWTVSGNDMYSAVSGNIGIRTSTPGTDLDIKDTGDGALLWLTRTDGTTGEVITELGSTASYGIIGTKSNNALKFRINGYDKMYIGTDGNVGIGTIDPTALFDVNGTLRFRNGASEGYILTSDASGNATWSPPFAGDPAPSGWIVSGENVYNSGSGNVGIGTSTPDYNLQVETTGVASTIETTRTDGADGFLKSTLANVIIGSRSDHDLTFNTTNGTKMTIQSTANGGNIGIGTTVPDKTLEINSATGNNLRLTYNDADGSAVNYTDFVISNAGTLSITPSSGTTKILGDIAATASNTGTLVVTGGIGANGGLSVSRTITDTGGTSAIANTFNSTFNANTVGSTGYEDGLVFQSLATGSNTHQAIRALIGAGYNNSTSTVNNMSGLTFVGGNLSTGGITNLTLANLSVYSPGSGAITNAVGLNLGNMNNYGSPTTSKSINLTANTTANGTSKYHIYAGNISGATDNYFIYSLGGQSYFAGNIGIGNTTPAYKLDVTGDINYTGTLYSNGSPLSVTGLWSSVTGGINYSSGNVGIGTTTPSRNLSIDGPLSQLGISSSGVERFVASISANLVDLNPLPDATGATAVRFFRTTNTTGTKRIDFLKGDGTATTQGRIGVDGQNSFFQIGGGNMGIGTAAPESTLDVEGTVSFKQGSMTDSSDAFDVSGATSFMVNTTNGNIVLGGLSGGVQGQIVYLAKITSSNSLTVEHNEVTGTQKIICPAGVDLIFNSYGGLTLLCNGTTWYVVSMAQ